MRLEGKVMKSFLASFVLSSLLLLYPASFTCAQQSIADSSQRENTETRSEQDIETVQADQSPEESQERLTPYQVWKEKTFTRNSFDENITDVLKAVARLNGTPITFGEGITDTITMEFREMPLKNAFKYLVERYGLSYYWDAGTLHVFKPDVSKTRDVLVSLENLEMSEVKKALNRFSLLKRELRMVFDPPTNTILLTGTERDIENVQNIIQVLETAKKKKIEVKPELRYFPLTYAKVDDTQITIGKKTVTVEGLVSVLTGVLHLTRVGEKKTVRVEAVSGGLEEAALQPETGTMPSGEKVRPGVLTSMVELEAGTIASDSRTNQIIIRDYPEKLDEYQQVIHHLDTPMEMVKIDVIIVEAAKDFAREFGVGYAGVRKEGKARGLYGTSGAAREALESQVEGEGDAITGGGGQDEEGLLDTGIPLLETAAGGTISSFGIAGSFIYTDKTSTLVGTLAAVEAKGVSRTINKSSIITMDNMKSIVEDKKTVTFKIQTGGDSPTVESKEIEAGLVLTVTPHIIHHEDVAMVEMMVEAERSSFLASRTDDIPEKTTTKMNTQVTIKDKGTVVVGGLFGNEYAAGETGIPCLMDIPLLGYLFKSATARNPMNNILFFLTPEVIALHRIPYEDVEFTEQIEGYERELRRIDPDKRRRLIEKFQKTVEE
jgi:type II secretory pathway component GspD/PulD (secretin)